MPPASWEQAAGVENFRYSWRKDGGRLWKGAQIYSWLEKKRTDQI